MQTHIFKYHNGKADVFGDPLALESSLIEAVGDLTPLLEKINKVNLNDPLQRLEGIQARRALIAGVRAAFELVPFDSTTGKGMTDDQALGVYLSWCDWTQKKSGNGPDTPSTSQPTDTTPPAPTPATTTTNAA